MKRRRVVKIVLWSTVLGYLVFSLLVLGIYVENTGTTYVLWHQSSTGEFFIRPYFLDNQTVFKIPLIFYYLSFSRGDKIYIGYVNKEDPSHPGRSAGSYIAMGSAVRVEKIKIHSAVYTTVKGERYDLLSNILKEQEDGSLTCKITFLPSEDDICETEGVIYFADGSNSKFSSNYMVKENTSLFSISLGIFQNY